MLLLYFTGIALAFAPFGSVKHMPSGYLFPNQNDITLFFQTNTLLTNFSDSSVSTFKNESGFHSVSPKKVVTEKEIQLKKIINEMNIIGNEAEEGEHKESLQIKEINLFKLIINNPSENSITDLNSSNIRQIKELKSRSTFVSFRLIVAFYVFLNIIFIFGCKMDFPNHVTHEESL